MARLYFSLTTTFLAMYTTMVLGNKKAEIFSKIADTTTRDLQATTTANNDGSSNGSAASAAAAEAEEGILGQVFDIFESLADKQWGTTKGSLDMDLMGFVRDVYLADEDHTRQLQEAWSDPEILRYLADELPFFTVIKPLRALKEKATLTPHDGLDAVMHLKGILGKLFASLQSVRDPEQFAAKMYKYATSSDNTWRSLLGRVEGGDETAHLEMQQFLLNEEIGDLIDLEAFGFGGVLPPILGKALESVRKDEPQIWKSVLTDPLTKRYLENPMLAVREVMEVTEEYAKGFGKSK